MQKFISDFYSETDLKIITPNDGKHYFFAYYDMRATGKNGKHLAHRVDFFDRIPTKANEMSMSFWMSRWSSLTRRP